METEHEDVEESSYGVGVVNDVVGGDVNVADVVEVAFDTPTVLLSVRRRRCCTIIPSLQIQSPTSSDLRLIPTGKDLESSGTFESTPCPLLTLSLVVIF